MYTLHRNRMRFSYIVNVKRWNFERLVWLSVIIPVYDG